MFVATCRYCKSLCITWRNFGIGHCSHKDRTTYRMYRHLFSWVVSCTKHTAVADRVGSGRVGRGLLRGLYPLPTHFLYVFPNSYPLGYSPLVLAHYMIFSPPPPPASHQSAHDTRVYRMGECIIHNIKIAQTWPRLYGVGYRLCSIEFLSDRQL